MRISDWSSDVCSSDLVLAGGDAAEHAAGVVRQEHRAAAVDAHLVGGLVAGDVGRREAVADLHALDRVDAHHRSEEHTSELQSLMRISYAFFCLKQKNRKRRILTGMELPQYVTRLFKDM